MVRLAQHRTEAAHLPHEPLHRLPALERRLGQEAPGLVREVEQDRSRFEERDLPSPGPVVVHDGRDLVVGADREELRLELIAATDVHPFRPVGEAAFLEHDVNLLTVRSGGGVEIDQVLILLDERVPRSLDDARGLSPTS